MDMDKIKQRTNSWCRNRSEKLGNAARLSFLKHMKDMKDRRLMK